MALGLLLIRFDFLYRKVLRKRSLFWKVVTWSSIIFVVSVIGLLKLIVSSNNPMAITKNFIYIEPLNSFFRRTDKSNETRDWNDYLLAKEDRGKVGFGEHGLKTYTDGVESEDEMKLIEMNGHNVLVSDKISLTRSVPDFRSVECKQKRFKKDLPTVSVVIPFYDEHLTTLLRTVHSVINRSPADLLKEVILINDASTKDDLYGQLQVYINKQGWSKLVRIQMMSQRSGLLWSRLAGARYAKGDVLLFMDCHIEAGYNFLPPLLDPIVDNYRSVVVPTLDIIDKHTYEIKPLGIGRTVFDWNFHAQRIPLAPEENNDTTLFETPTMYGAAFAISAKYFWELQPDPWLLIYGADQLEMSFKINLCGGKLYESPCSRVAHLYRRFPYAKHQSGFDYKARNNKRVAEIWLDDYKQYFYARHPDRYHEDMEIGDITKQLELKKKLNCKPFSHFLENIAPDMLERFPLIEYDNFASGTIRNKAIGKCIQTADAEHGGLVTLDHCSNNKTNPVHQQHFMLRHFRDIMIHGKSDCLEGGTRLAYVKYARCHFQQGNQYFRYDVNNHHIFFGRKRDNLCIDTDPKSLRVYINICDRTSDTQKWIWGFSRVSALRQWIRHGAPIEDEIELQDLALNTTDFMEITTTINTTPKQEACEGKPQ